MSAHGVIAMGSGYVLVVLIAIANARPNATEQAMERVRHVDSWVEAVASGRPPPRVSHWSVHSAADLVAPMTRLGGGFDKDVNGSAVRRLSKRPGAQWWHTPPRWRDHRPAWPGLHLLVQRVACATE